MKHKLNIAERLYWKLHIIQKAARIMCLALMFVSTRLLEIKAVPIGVSFACFFLGAFGGTFAIFLPQAFWRCPYCRGNLKAGRRGRILKPDKSCPHCDKVFESV